MNLVNMGSMAQYLNMRLFETVRVLDVEGLKHVITQHRANPTCRLDVDAALCLAAKSGNIETVRLLLQAKASVTYVDRDGNRALHHAARSGSWKVVKLILNAGSPMNISDNNGATALHIAVEGGHEELVRMLLQEGANTNRARLYRTGETPLHLACKKGHMQIPMLLISRGADVNVASTSERRTPLHYAVKCKNFHTVRLLCQKNAKVNCFDAKGCTPLSIAVEAGSHENTDCLLRYGADPRLQDRSGRTPLHTLAIATSASESQLGIAQHLLHLGAEVNQRDAEGCTPLHYAAISGNTEFATLLISAGAEVNVQDYNKADTPLNTAVAHDRGDMAQLLIHSGADVTLTDNRGLTALHSVQGCRSSAKVEITRLLINKGARLNVLTCRGDSPLDRCVFHFVLGNYNREVLITLVVAGAILRQTPGRPPHQSPLCWLTWHSQFSSARFLVMVGWSLHSESWLHLPGKTPAAETFLDWLREVARQPQQLTLLCRKHIREILVTCSGDRNVSPVIQQLPLPTVVKRQLMLEEEVRMFMADEL